ncbi:GntR family transcriptional regulator [Cohnella lubricantis]|uniref:GntR family transcriptional regulator n=1 Tax=Cohnella lubricantis TaxID=2163172 RepID=A0A841T908_9BACL|nr:GntR family transcriptional regulator [Cohnella lubricantis]MBB6676536.1 GntR family transcriptional regulator [Cohnella lubricantis]MBP2120530.1 DNA-binding LacI/PurR family transcriptional regulator [Cohnella lubricantis]
MKNQPLYKQIQDEIKELIREGKLRPGDRVPSEKELAEQFHVSQITSKNALIGLADEGILIRHQGKGTFVNQDVLSAHIPSLHAAAADGRQKRGLIGLIVPTLRTKVEQRIVQHIERFAVQHGYQVILRISRESQLNESEAIESMIACGAQGIIIFPTEEETYNEDILRLSLNKFPLVLIDRYLKEIRTYSVSADNIAGTYEAVSYMLRQGHEHIALISPEITNTVTEDRARGFEKAFSDQNLPINKNMWCIVRLEEVHDRNVSSLIRDFLADRPEITAAFVMNAELSQTAFQALKKLERPVPEDFLLFGFDDPDCPGVCYVEQDEEAMCKQSVSFLLEQMEGTFNPQRVAIPVKLNIKV